MSWDATNHAETSAPPQVIVPNSVTADQVSAFSSYGPALDLSFKPDLSAPGNLIVSRFSCNSGCFVVGVAATKQMHSSAMTLTTCQA